MTLILTFILGAAVGILAMHFFRLSHKHSNILENVRISHELKSEREQSQQKILRLLTEQGKVTNNDVERLLGVSDATATRYLDALEEKGKIRQVGNAGKYVYYERV